MYVQLLYAPWRYVCMHGEMTSDVQHLHLVALLLSWAQGDCSWPRSPGLWPLNVSFGRL